MRIEDEVFGKYTVNKSKLLDYGFTCSEDNYVYKTTLVKADFEIVIEYSDAFRGKVIDLGTGEEYVNYRLPGASGFSAEIKDEFTSLLEDIRDKCCENQLFITEQARRINTFIQNEYSVNPEFLWKKLPSYAAFRKSSSKKWFALIGTVAYNKLNKASNDDSTVEIINIKVKIVDDHLGKPGFFPAYHMNKKSWITILFDNKVDDEVIKALINESYESV